MKKRNYIISAIGLLLLLSSFLAYAGYYGSGGTSSSGSGGGITSINGDTTAAQLITSGTSGADVAVSTSGGTTTVNVPTASGSARGALSSANWTTFNSKVGGSTGGTDNALLRSDGTGGSTTQASDVIVDDSENFTGVNSLQFKTGGTGIDNVDDSFTLKTAGVSRFNSSSGGLALYEHNDTSDYFNILVNSDNYVRAQLRGNVDILWLQTINSNNGPTISMVTPGSTNEGSIAVRGSSYGTRQGDMEFTVGSSDNYAFTAGSSLLQVRGTTGHVILGAHAATPTHELNTATVAAGAQTGTMTNFPVAGNPSAFIRIRINGNMYFIPAWSAP